MVSLLKEKLIVALILWQGYLNFRVQAFRQKPPKKNNGHGDNLLSYGANCPLEEHVWH